MKKTILIVLLLLVVIVSKSQFKQYFGPEINIDTLNYEWKQESRDSFCCILQGDTIFRHSGIFRHINYVKDDIIIRYESFELQSYGTVLYKSKDKLLVELPTTRYQTFVGCEKNYYYFHNLSSEKIHCKSVDFINNEYVISDSILSEITVGDNLIYYSSQLQAYYGKNYSFTIKKDSVAQTYIDHIGLHEFLIIDDSTILFKIDNFQLVAESVYITTENGVSKLSVVPEEIEDFSIERVIVDKVKKSIEFHVYDMTISFDTIKVTLEDVW